MVLTWVIWLLLPHYNDNKEINTRMFSFTTLVVHNMSEHNDIRKQAPPSLLSSLPTWVVSSSRTRISLLEYLLTDIEIPSTSHKSPIRLPLNHQWPPQLYTVEHSKVAVSISDQADQSQDEAILWSSTSHRNKGPLAHSCCKPLSRHNGA